MALFMLTGPGILMSPIQTQMAYGVWHVYYLYDCDDGAVFHSNLSKTISPIETHWTRTRSTPKVKQKPPGDMLVLTRAHFE